MHVETVLKSIGFEEFIGTCYEKDFSLKQLNKKELDPLHGKILEKCFYVVEGSVRMIFYSPDGRELTWTFERDSWFGMEDLIAGEEAYLFDIEGTEDSLLLEVPLKRLLSHYKSREFYSRLLKIMADFSYSVGNKLALMMNYTHEERFLKFLQDNGYRIEGKKICEISDLIKINLRTLQRIIKDLEASGIIVREQDSIKVTDLERYSKYSSLSIDTKIF